MMKTPISLCVISTAMLSLGFMSSTYSATETTSQTNLPVSPSKSSEQSILNLDFEMMGIYDNAQKGFKEEFLSQHPVILAQFNISGGELTLYRPGKEPLKAPPVPIVYQLLKAVSHSSLAVFEIVDSHLETVADQSWRESMMAYRASCQTAFEGLKALNIDNDTKEYLHNTLKKNIQFMDMCLSKGTYTLEDIQQYIAGIKPDLVKNIRLSAYIQVRHWMKVVKDWKELIGADWDKTYAATDTLYMLRQNNVLFSILAQFFGKEALNTRLFLFETTAFDVTSDQILDLLMRTVADRSIGLAFFGSYYMMDNDITGGDAREAIQSEGKRLGLSIFLPPEVPFHSTEWPWRIDPAQGEGPATIKQIK